MNRLPYFVFISFLLFHMKVHAQTFSRPENESKESFVSSTLDSNFVLTGAYEFSTDTSNLILYFQQQNLNEYYLGVTTIHALYSTNKISFTKYLIDSIGSSNSCWLPYSIDTMYLINVDNDIEKEICLVLRHIPICDAYLPTIEIMFFDNAETFNRTENLKELKDFHFQIFSIPLPSSEKVYEKIIATLKLRENQKN